MIIRSGKDGTHATSKSKAAPEVQAQASGDLKDFRRKRLRARALQES
jgi:hypothetical protein